MGVTAGQTTPARIEARERQGKAVTLRKEGYSYSEIAAHLGYNSASAAWDAVKRALAATIQEPCDELRKLELSRLDEMWKTAYKQAMAGEPAAIAACLRILERRAAMQGLDAPKKTELNAEVTTTPSVIVVPEKSGSVEEWVEKYGKALVPKSPSM